MKITIIIKKGRKEEKIRAGGFFLIVSDPNKFKGIRFWSSHITESIPRMMGWVEWARVWLKRQANKAMANSEREILSEKYKREKKNF